MSTRRASAVTVSEVTVQAVAVNVAGLTETEAAIQAESGSRGAVTQVTVEVEAP